MYKVVKNKIISMIALNGKMKDGWSFHHASGGTIIRKSANWPPENVAYMYFTDNGPLEKYKVEHVKNVYGSAIEGRINRAIADGWTFRQDLVFSGDNTVKTYLIFSKPISDISELEEEPEKNEEQE